jgi:hypothetical protein
MFAPADHAGARAEAIIKGWDEIVNSISGKLANWYMG